MWHPGINISLSLSLGGILVKHSIVLLCSENQISCLLQQSAENWCENTNSTTSISIPYLLNWSWSCTSHSHFSDGILSISPVSLMYDDTRRDTNIILVLSQWDFWTLVWRTLYNKVNWRVELVQPCQILLRLITFTTLWNWPCAMPSEQVET